MGSVGKYNKWVHRYKIAQGSKEAKCGKGRRARKNMMPELLHKEMLKAAKAMHDADQGNRMRKRRRHEGRGEARQGSADRGWGTGGSLEDTVSSREKRQRTARQEIVETQGGRPTDR